MLLLALLCGCASYPYPVQDAGDGVYYAAGPPDYQYVSGYAGPYPYYGPYSYYSPYFYPYFFSVWTSPLIEAHYAGWRGPMIYPYWPRHPVAYGYLPVKAGTVAPVELGDLYRNTAPSVRLPANPDMRRLVDRADVMRPGNAYSSRPLPSKAAIFNRRNSPSYPPVTGSGPSSRMPSPKASITRPRPSSPGSPAPRPVRKQ